MCVYRHRSVQSVKVIDRHSWQKKTNLVPSELDVVASVGLDHQNPMRPSTVYLSLFPAAPSVSNLFSEAVWEKGIFTYL